MEFKVGNRRSLITPKYSALEEKYPHFMQLYRDYPTDIISFKEFEECTAERLSILQIIDEISMRGLKGDEWISSITSEVKKLPQLRQFSKLITGTRSVDSETDTVMRRRDHVSHFVLRMAYCINEEKRRWFVSKETDLFRFRWHHMTTDERTTFLTLNSINYDKVPHKMKVELEKLSEGMVKSCVEYFQVPFTLVSDLMRTRKVYLRRGVAYITTDDIISVLLSSFRSQLSHSLTAASRKLHRLDEDERIQFVLRGAAGRQVREVDYVSEDKDTIDIASLDELCRSSYPLCMQQLHQRLRQDHHLRHFGRQQYGLFLKGIGVTLKDSLHFWRMEFTKKMDLDKFEKSHSYNIRYNYGLEGKKTNYTPYSCVKIISSSVAPGESHGCPFRHRDQAVVKQMLSYNGLSSSGVEEVLELVGKKQYQMACSRCFQVRHPGSELAVNHPNAYFDESQRSLRASKTSQQPDSASSLRHNKS